MAWATIREFLAQATAQGARSSALNPLGWLIAILMAGIVTAIKVGAVPWLLILLAIFAGVVIALYVVAYIYFMVKSPDALRSERFTLQKMAMEKGLIGDNLTGLRAPEVEVDTKLLPVPD